MSLQDEVAKIQGEIRVKKLMEEELIKLALECRAEQVYADMKNAILSLCRQGEKNIVSAIGVDCGSFSYSTSENSFIKVKNDGFAGNKEKEMAFSQAVKDFSSYAKEAKYVKIERGEVYVRNLFDIKISGVFHKTFEAKAKNITFLLNEVKRLANEDEVYLHWNMKISNGTSDKSHVEFPFDKIVKSHKYFNNGYAYYPMIVIYYSYEVKDGSGSGKMKAN